MAEKKAYIVIAHSFRPAEGQNTSMKDFGTKKKKKENGQWLKMSIL